MANQVAMINRPRDGAGLPFTYDEWPGLEVKTDVRRFRNARIRQ
jgi:hypothetical protein